MARAHARSARARRFAVRSGPALARPRARDCFSSLCSPFFVDAKYFESWPMPFIAWRAALYVSCAARRAQWRRVAG